MSELVPAPPPAVLPAQLFTPTPKAARRVLEFFTNQINNDHMRKAYLNAARRFADWCEERGIRELAAVEPFHVAAFVKQLQGEFSALTVKQHLAALRMLFGVTPFQWTILGCGTKSPADARWPRLELARQLYFAQHGKKETVLERSPRDQSFPRGRPDLRIEGFKV